MCNEPFSRNHRCLKKQLYSQILEIGDEVPMDGEALSVGSDKDKGEAKVELYAINGETGREGIRTMKMQGNYERKPLYILVDSGSTHNFLDLSTVKGLNIAVESITPVIVAVADGRSVFCNKMVTKFSWVIQGVEFQADFYILTLG
ncbi:hypothetical protein MLD38_019077 [Melastoma candidum]|uniref:Uncharacterized protein n=1 Tax=Melastoma candidum TaxID=119954 RepID=A0ACB9QV92_9MYRT|nr:hypothetical protein MLD38_019077 [Melastoma candidum]